jgi:hypothetical protein
VFGLGMLFVLILFPGGLASVPAAVIRRFGPKERI